MKNGTPRYRQAARESALQSGAQDYLKKAYRQHRWVGRPRAALEFEHTVESKSDPTLDRDTDAN